MIADGATITPENRAAWLAGRRETIGASEAPSICGVGYSSPIDIWQQKLGLAPPTLENEAMRLGTLLEPIVAQEYRRVTGATFDEQVFVTHPEPELAWMVATLDGFRSDGIVVEFKTAGAYKADEWGEEGTDQIPEGYLVQVHHQLEIVRARSHDEAGHVAHVFVLIGGQQFKGPYVIERDDDLVHAIITRESEFRDCVLRKRPPDWGKRDARMLAIINPTCFGEIDIDEATGHLVHLYGSLKEREKENTEALEELKCRILDAMGTAQIGRLPDGRIVKRYREETPGRVETRTIKPGIRHYFKVLKGDSK